MPARLVSVLCAAQTKMMLHTSLHGVSQSLKYCGAVTVAPFGLARCTCHCNADLWGQIGVRYRFICALQTARASLLADRQGGKVGHAKYKCFVCSVQVQNQTICTPQTSCSAAHLATTTRMGAQ